MANTKISALPPADALDGAELVPVVQAGATKQTTAGDVANTATDLNVTTITAATYVGLPVLGITGTGTAGQVALWDGPTSQAGDAGLIYDTGVLKLGGGISTTGGSEFGQSGAGIVAAVSFYSDYADGTDYSGIFLQAINSGSVGLLVNETALAAGNITNLTLGFDGLASGRIVLATSDLTGWKLANNAGGKELFPLGNNDADLGIAVTNELRTGYFGTSVITPLVSSTPVALDDLGDPITQAGTRAFISDGLTLGTWGGTAVDGGVVVKPVWSNGVAWLNG